MGGGVDCEIGGFVWFDIQMKPGGERPMTLMLCGTVEEWRGFFDVFKSSCVFLAAMTDREVEQAMVDAKEIVSPMRQPTPEEISLQRRFLERMK